MVITELESFFAEKHRSAQPEKRKATTNVTKASTPASILSLISQSKPSGSTEQPRASNRGEMRKSYNEGVTRVPGLYNEKAVVEVTVDPVHEYDFMYLSTFERTNALN